MKKHLILVVLILIQGCFGGGDGPSKTDPDTVFQTFPSGYFTQGYTDTLNYTGTDTVGGVYTATVSLHTQSQTTFLGVPAIPIEQQLELTDTAHGGFTSTNSTSYFSPLATDRHYLGSSNSTTTVSAITSAIPQTAKIGDSGDVGTYTDNAGDVDVQSWRLDEGFSGNANIVRLVTIKDQFGNLLASTVITTKIDVDGNTLSEKIVMFLADINVTVTLNGS